jgi:glucose/arabinose dehydrogenase
MAKLLILIVLVLLAAAFWFWPGQRSAPAETESPATQPPLLENLLSEETKDIETVASDLTIPWEIAFLADNTLLVTERPGRLLKIGQDKSVIPIEGVAHVGEGGLLGLALHPEFAENNLLYLYLTSQTDKSLTNRVERYRLEGTTLHDRQVIIENIPGSSIHDGGRLAFGPDKLLYVTTGDAGQESLAQNRSSLAGKILRLKDDGSIPEDNPFGSAVYSLGHRNSQGLAWDSQGRLWATEHGRSGVRSGFDEVNLIEKGQNYGWPTIEGSEMNTTLRTPAAHSGAATTWAPSGAAIVGNTLLFAGLRGESLYKTEISDTTLSKITPHFAGEFGRLRTVAVGPDGMLYLLTNNRDGRGTPRDGDDKIIRLDPKLLEQ